MSLAAGMERDADPAPPQQNRRPSNQLLVNKDGRKPLFGSGAPREENAKSDEHPRSNSRRLRPGGAAGDASWWRSGSDSQPSAQGRRDSASGQTPSGDTRLPRPKSTTGRRAKSIAESWKMAGDEEDQDHGHPADGSPSPAPRTWHSRLASDTTGMRKGPDGAGVDAKERGMLSASAGAREEAARKPSTSSDKNGGLLGRSKAAETGRELAKVTGNEGSPRERPSGGTNKPRTGSGGEQLLGGRIPDLVPGIEDVPLPSVEGGTPGLASPMRQTSRNADSLSPEKSYAWQVDQDFTAGDLQVSDSPRIKVGDQPFANRLAFNDNSDIDIHSRARLNHPGSHNTKLDLIRLREARAGKDEPVQRNSPRPPNTRLDEIRAREESAEKEIPIPNRHLTRLRNSKLDEIRQREQHPLTDRAMAMARLGEVREQNSMARSLTPDEPRPHSSQELARDTTPDTRIPMRSKSAFEAAGERIPDTPITVYKNRDRVDASSRYEAQPNASRNGPGTPVASGAHRRSDSRDLLQKLARATSSSPAPAPEGRRPPAKNGKNNDRLDVRARPGGRKGNSGRRNGNGEPGAAKRSVGFAGLRRMPSTESTKSKRSSMHSEMDPTDRIEGEMKLFALQDNHSERGSVRAPSPGPEPEDEGVEATPRPKKQEKQDPLSLPTPKVTGAYVETPATIKVERWEDTEQTDKGGKEDAGDATKNEADRGDSPALPLEKRASWRNRDRDTASDPGTGEVEKNDPIKLLEARKLRPRSLPRRKPPLRNSARLPSVKDDLLELRRTHNVEDSTLEDLEELFAGRKPLPQKAAPLTGDLDSESDEDVPDPPSKGDDKAEDLDAAEGGADLEKAKRDLAAYERIDKGLLTAMRETHTVRKGIERLGDRVSHFEKQPPDVMDELEMKHTDTRAGSDTRAHTHDHTDKHHQCPECAAQPHPSAVAYIHIPVPRLYHRTPRFRLTLLGVIVTVLSLWSAAESAMCAMYCRPETCASPPCVWSFNDPSFGAALPVKLDQWATGGHGRETFRALVEEAEDWAADVLDSVHGRDVADADVSAMTFRQKRQHRRRLRKKGLARTRPETPEQRAKWDAWHETRLAKERAKEARAMGYAVADEEGESIDGDERVW